MPGAKLILGSKLTISWKSCGQECGVGSKTGRTDLIVLGVNLRKGSVDLMVGHLQRPVGLQSTWQAWHDGTGMRRGILLAETHLFRLSGRLRALRKEAMKESGLSDSPPLAANAAPVLVHCVARQVSEGKSDCVRRHPPVS